MSSGNRPLPEPSLPEAPLESGCGVMGGQARASPPSMPVTLCCQNLPRLHGFLQDGQHGGGLWGRIESGPDELSEGDQEETLERPGRVPWLQLLSLDSGHPLWSLNVPSPTLT